MPEPTTLAATGMTVAYVSKDLLSKLLGPTADYLGGELANSVEKLSRILGEYFYIRLNC